MCVLVLHHRPAGWDNEKKIAILYENMHTMTPEDYYTDVIVRPPVVRKVRIRSPSPLLGAFGALIFFSFLIFIFIIDNKII